MPEIQHNGPGFVYVLTTKQVGRPDEELETYTINDWRIIRKEILVNNIYEPYEIKLQAKNGPGFAREPVVMKIGYSGEASKLFFVVDRDIHPKLFLLEISWIRCYCIMKY